MTHSRRRLRVLPRVTDSNRAVWQVRFASNPRAGVFVEAPGSTLGASPRALLARQSGSGRSLRHRPSIPPLPIVFFPSVHSSVLPACLIVLPKPASAVGDNSGRRLLRGLPKHIDDHDGISINTVHNAPRNRFVHDTQFMTARANRRHRRSQTSGLSGAVTIKIYVVSDICQYRHRGMVPGHGRSARTRSGLRGPEGQGARSGVVYKNKWRTGLHRCATFIN